MIAHSHIYDGLVDLLAQLDPAKILAFHASDDIQARVETLLAKKKETALSAPEQEELDHYFVLEHIVRLAKSRALLQIKQQRA